MVLKEKAADGMVVPRLAKVPKPIGLLKLGQGAFITLASQINLASAADARGDAQDVVYLNKISLSRVEGLECRGLDVVVVEDFTQAVMAQALETQLFCILGFWASPHRLQGGHIMSGCFHILLSGSVFRCKIIIRFCKEETQGAVIRIAQDEAVEKIHRCFERFAFNAKRPSFVLCFGLQDQIFMAFDFVPTIWFQCLQQLHGLFGMRFHQG